MHTHQPGYDEGLLGADLVFYHDLDPLGHRRGPGQHKPDPGFLYVCDYACAPGRLKIGLTRKSPIARLAQISAETSAPGPARLLIAFQTPFCGKAELGAHRAFSDERRKGEWFDITTQQALGMMIGEAIVHNDMRAQTRLWITPDFLSQSNRREMGVLREAGLGLDFDAA